MGYVELVKSEVSKMVAFLSSLLGSTAASVGGSTAAASAGGASTSWFSSLLGNVGKGMDKVNGMIDLKMGEVFKDNRRVGEFGGGGLKGAMVGGGGEGGKSDVGLMEVFQQAEREFPSASSRKRRVMQSSGKSVNYK